MLDNPCDPMMTHSTDSLKYLFHSVVHWHPDTGCSYILGSAALLGMKCQHGLVHQLSPWQLVRLQPEQKLSHTTEA